MMVIPKRVAIPRVDEVTNKGKRVNVCRREEQDIRREKKRLEGRGE